ncbi:MAG: glycosyltransferase, partial [Ignavibacteriaceae bacterium]
LRPMNFPFELYVLCNNRKFKENNFISVPKLNTVSLSEFLKDKDIYISASEYEPFSIAAAECISEGLVSIVTEETGLSEYITNKSNGFIIKFNDTKDLIQILNFINSNKDSLHLISEAGKKIYVEISWSAVLDKYKKLYI